MQTIPVQHDFLKPSTLTQRVAWTCFCAIDGNLTHEKTWQHFRHTFPTCHLLLAPQLYFHPCLAKCCLFKLGLCSMCRSRAKGESWQPLAHMEVDLMGCQVVASQACLQQMVKGSQDGKGLSKWQNHYPKVIIPKQNMKFMVASSTHLALGESPRLCKGLSQPHLEISGT